MKKTLAAPACIALLLTQTAAPALAATPLEDAALGRGAVSAEAPRREAPKNLTTPPQRPLTCAHPLTGQNLRGQDCAALLSVLLLGALANKTGPLEPVSQPQVRKAPAR